jgi:predicted ATPase
MIHQVSFRNFKALRSVDLSLERLTVIVGPNASGKTSILQGLYYLSQLTAINNFQEFFKETRNPIDLYSRDGKGDLEVSVAMAEGEARFTLRFPEHYRDDLLLARLTPWVVPNWGWQPDAAARNRGRGGEPGGPESGADNSWTPLFHRSAVSAALRRSALVRLDPGKLAGPSWNPIESLGIKPDGTGLPSALASMALTYPDEFQELQRLVREIIAGVERIRFVRVPLYRLSGGGFAEFQGPPGEASADQVVLADSLVFDMHGAPSLRGHLASEGTLVVVGLLTILLRPPRPNLVLIDDLGQALHPKAQQELVGLLRKLLEQFPELQIVATTHSPYLLDQLHPEEVRLASLAEDGAATCAELTEHPEFERWKDEMTPGEFWSLIGEKWVATRNGVGSLS